MEECKARSLEAAQDRIFRIDRNSKSQIPDKNLDWSDFNLEFGVWNLESVFAE